MVPLQEMVLHWCAANWWYSAVCNLLIYYKLSITYYNKFCLEWRRG